MSTFLRKKYRIRGDIGSNHHIIVMVSPRDIEVYGEQLAVGMAAWNQLMENEKDSYGFPTDRPSATQRMLRELCMKLGGVESVKKKFITTIVYSEENDDDKAH